MPTAEQPGSIPSATEIGTAHPIVVEAASQDARWVVFCQARTDSDANGSVSVRLAAHGKLEGDELVRYIAHGSGPGQRLDALLAHDPSGRFLVIEREKKALLIDTERRSELDLKAQNADLLRDSAPFAAHRTLAFDRSGKNMLYVRRTERGSEIVVLDLMTRAERVIGLPAGVLWRSEFSSDGNWVIVHVLTGDTNNNRRIDWPTPPDTGSQSRCAERAPLASYAAWLERGDRVSVLVAASSGGSLRAVDGFVAGFGAGLVVRDPNGRLLSEQNGARQEIAPAKCAARVYHVDGVRQRLLYACTNKGPVARAPLVLWAQGRRQELALTIVPAGPDRWRTEPERLVPVYAGRETALVDVQALRVLSLQPGDGIVASHDATALIRRAAGTLLLFDAESAKETIVARGVQSLFDQLVTARVALVSPWVVDLERGKALGRISERPLALARDGRVLVALGGQPSADSLAKGPITWKQPLMSEPGAD